MLLENLYKYLHFHAKFKLLQKIESFFMIYEGLMNANDKKWH